MPYASRLFLRSVAHEKSCAPQGAPIGFIHDEKGAEAPFSCQNEISFSDG
jgi:hypothetical protein